MRRKPPNASDATHGSGDAEPEQHASEVGDSTSSPATKEGPDAPHPTIAELEAKVGELSKALEHERDQVVRSVAEFQNFRKRVQQEKVQLQKFAIETLVLDLIPVLDNFERTTTAMNSGAAIEAVAEGVQAVERQLRTVLEGRHVTRVPAKGVPFDPELHEAVATEESVWYPEGTVIEELEPGYKLNDRVIRPARVKVSRKP